MRPASRLALLVAMTVGGMAFAAPTASGQVEVTSESDGGAHCGAVTPTLSGATGGCFFHRGGEGALVSVEVFGDPLTECSSSSDGRIDEDGHGYFYNQILGGGAVCVAVPCAATNGSGFRPWEFQMGEPSPGVEHLVYSFCVVVGGVQLDCTLEVAQTVMGHTTIELDANQAPCAEDETLHVTGHWTVIADPANGRPELEIIHPGIPAP